MLTVRETFMFSASLRIPNKTAEERAKIVENTINLLKLTHCADSKVGSELVRGLSGGEKRRVSIGVDVIHQPKVIFLDEPTSGLDSTTAYTVVESLKHMVGYCCYTTPDSLISNATL